MPDKIPSCFTFVRSFQGIEEYVLDNGLKVLLFPDGSSSSVTVNITYLVGSRHEGLGEAGMAHLLEHMLFRGSEAIPDVKAVLQERGANFNATTWYDRTNYFETLTPTKENLEFVLRLEADRMINSKILQSDLDSEMTVVRNEFEMGENNPVHVLHDQVMSASFRWHNYGKTTIGNRSDIERVKATSLKKFYKHYYQPDNAVLIVSGQFNQRDALHLIEKYFAPIRKPDRILQSTYTDEPAQDGPRKVTLQRTGDVPAIVCAYHIPRSVSNDHPAIKIAMDCLCDEPSGYLYKELVESNQASEIFSMVYSLFDPGMAMVFIRPNSIALTDDCQKKLIDLIEHKAKNFINEAQVTRIKKRILKNFKMAATNSKSLSIKLSEAIACGDWRLFFWYKNQIEKVTYDDVFQALEYYFVESNRTLGVFIPSKKIKRAYIKPDLDIKTALNDLVEDTSLMPGEDFIASASSIESKVLRKEVKKDFKAAVLTKKTRGQSVLSKIIYRFGNEDALLPYKHHFSLMPSMLERSTKNLGYLEIKDKLDSLMSSVSLDGFAGYLEAFIKSENKYITEALKLTHTLIHEPAFKKDEFEIIKKREIDDYEEIKSDPQRIASRELERLKNPWPKESIHYITTFDEKLEALKHITHDSMKNAYEKILSTDVLAISAVGDCENQDFFDAATSILKPKRANVSYKRIGHPYIENAPKDIIIDTKDKEMSMIALGFTFPMRDDHLDYPSLKLANYMFGENMNSRLMNRIREKEGISYGASSSLDISRHENNASLNIYAMAAPQNVSRAKAAILEEWEKILRDGFSDSEIANAQQSIWLVFENILSNDTVLTSVLATDLDIGRDFYWREKIYKKIKTLDKNEIVSAMNTWWRDKKFSIVTAGDRDFIK